jgi:hypothetical protein
MSSLLLLHQRCGGPMPREEISLTPGQQEQMGRWEDGKMAGMTRFRSGASMSGWKNGVVVPELGSPAAALPALCLYRQFCACSWHRPTLLVCRAAAGGDDVPRLERVKCYTIGSSAYSQSCG